MICIDNPYTDPYFNLAAEEYLFRDCMETVFMLWRNRPSVVIGKHQDARREFDSKLAAARGIKLVRRLTGGGAVYHDLGNFNLTFIGDCRSVLADRLTESLAAFLRSLGLPVSADDRRNLWIDGKKISGSAQGIRKDRCIHHATLLFSSDLALLTAVLRGDDDASGCERPFSVASVKSPVANLCDYLPPALAPCDFRRRLFAFGSTQPMQGHPYLFTPHDLAAIGYLKANKYATRLWNYRVQTEPCLPVAAASV